MTKVVTAEVQFLMGLAYLCYTVSHADSLTAFVI